jgi:4-amino-4-deoxy-L-arabinose transferase-like glycosyltransferase
MEIDIKFFKSEKFLLLVLLAITFFMYFINLGGPSLFETDEVIYSQVAREIVRTGDMVTMHLFGKNWFIHPPMYMWLAAASSFIFGFTEFNIRFWNALMAVGLVFTTYLLGRKLFKDGVGLMGAFILATGMQYIVQAHLAIFDIPYILFMFLAVYMLFLYMESRLARYYYLAGILLGISMLIKGPVGILLPGLVFTIYLISTKNLKALYNFHFIPVALLTAAIGGSWYFAEAFIHGKVFVDSVVAFYLVGRFTTTIEAHYGPSYFYVLIVLIGFLPWLPFLLFSTVHQIQNIKKNENLFCVIWMFTIFIFFSIAKTKLPGYILSLYPIAAISIAQMLNKYTQEQPDDVAEEVIVGEKRKIQFWAILSLIGIFGRFLFVSKGMMVVGDYAIDLLIVGLLMIFYNANKRNSISKYISGSFKALLMTSVLLIVIASLFKIFDAPDGLEKIFSDLNIMFFIMGAGSFIASLYYFKYKDAGRPFVILVGSMVIFAWFTSCYTLMDLDDFKPMRAISQKVNSLYTGKEMIIGYDILNKGSIKHYLDKPVIWQGDDIITFRRTVDGAENVFLIVNTKDFPGIGQEFKRPTFVLYKSRDLMLLYKKQ